MTVFIKGLLMDGYLPVFLTLLDFLPTVVVLLTVVSLFENSNIALGFGCTTLAVSNTCSDKHQIRFLTFIPCSAKLPCLMFIIGAILGWNWFGVVWLYGLSIWLGLLLGGWGVIKCPRLKKFSLKTFITSILKNIIEFLKRISFGLVLAVTVLYTMQYFGWLLPVTRIFEPIFMPIGLGNAMIIACLLFGLVAKEMIIGAILAFGVANLGLTTATALSFLVFVLLYTPCIPALTAIRAKVGFIETAKVAVFNFAVAYMTAFVVYVVTVLLLL